MVLSLKPVGPACNMKCSYCYYVEKFAGSSHGVMSEQTLELAIRQYSAAMPPEADLHFLWHGGEPLLMAPDFYRKALELQRRYAAGRRIFNSLQTNGTLIDDEKAEFFAKEDWLLGISIDGPRRFNEMNRRFNDGASSFDVLVDRIALLKRHGVKWNAMATVNSVNVGHPVEFYDFFKRLGTQFLQFSPIVERRREEGSLASPEDYGAITPESITARQWGDFLCAVFDRWLAGDVGKMFVQIFDTTLAAHIGANPGFCIFSPVCGGEPVVEANGDVYCCDHFVFDRFRIGNIHQDDLGKLLESENLSRFGMSKRKRLPQECLDCRFLALCNGECPKNRFVKSSSGAFAPLNYLCEGYKMYFEHTLPFMLKAKRHILGK